MSDKMETFRTVLRNLWEWSSMGGAIAATMEGADSIIRCAAEEAGLPYNMLYVTLINDETDAVIDEGNIVDIIADHSGAKISAAGLSMVAGSINIRITEETGVDLNEILAIMKIAIETVAAMEREEEEDD